MAYGARARDATRSERYRAADDAKGPPDDWEPLSHCRDRRELAVGFEPTTA